MKKERKPKKKVEFGQHQFKNKVVIPSMCNFCDLGGNIKCQPIHTAIYRIEKRTYGIICENFTSKKIDSDYFKKTGKVREKES